MTVDAILKQVDELTADQRDELLDRLTERYGPSDIDPALAALLDERVAAYEANPGAVYTLDETLARARRAP